MCHLSVRLPHSLNILSSETAGPIKVKFQMEPPWDGGTKISSNGPCHMTKMATMPIYGKNIKKIFFSGIKRPITLKLGMQHGMDGWVRVLRPFISISVISRRWKGEHERLCAMKRRLGSGRISPPAGFEPATPWSEVGSANRSATRMQHGVLKYYHIYSNYDPGLTFTYFTARSNMVLYAFCIENR